MIYCGEACNKAAYAVRAMLGRRCSVDGCTDKYRTVSAGRHFCGKHYREELKKKLASGEIQRRKCSVDGCDQDHYGKELCRKHYRWKFESTSVAGFTGSCKQCAEPLPKDARPDQRFCNARCQMRWHKTHGCYTLERRLEVYGRCLVDGCETVVHGKGFCHTHFQTWLRHGDPMKIMYPPVKCAEPGCNTVGRWKRGLCTKHYFSEYGRVHRDEIRSNLRAREARVAAATPPWLNEEQMGQIKKTYMQSMSLSKSTGQQYSVDHIVPLANAAVCGLHVPWNLEVMLLQPNRKKSNVFPMMAGTHPSILTPTPSKYWKDMDAVQLEQYAQHIFEQARSFGYPYFHRPTERHLHERVNKARSAIRVKPIIRGNEVHQSHVLCGDANSFFPHMATVRCAGTRTPMEAFMNDAAFLSAIKRRLKYGDHISMSGIRKSLSNGGGAQSVSNFRPTAAAALFSEFCREGAVVYDPCAGWGGRLMGAAISREVVKYIACEPSTKTHAGLMEMVGMLKGFVNAEIHLECAEDFSPQEPVDLVLTSPPYFNTEQYSDEPTQSFVRWPSDSQWRERFLKPMLERSWASLRVGGVAIFNVNDVATYRTLADDTCGILQSLGGIHERTMRYMLSGRIEGYGARSEPIFVFRKVQ